MNGALLLLVRSVSTAMLTFLGGRWLLAYLLGDLGLFLLYKIGRNDLLHWMRLDGKLAVFGAVIERTLVKILVDYTGVVQMRGAGEMGGAWWSFSMLVALIASFVATHVYYATEDDPVLEKQTAWIIVGGLSASWAIFFALFLGVMKKKYWGTFFSTKTGHEWVKDHFLQGASDERKMEIHRLNRSLWREIRDEVKEWTLLEWERMEEEGAEWFNDALKGSVDDDMIPPESLRKMKGGGERRRSSLGDDLGFSGGVRAGRG